MSKLEELRKQRTSIDGQIKEEEERVLREKEGAVLDKIRTLSDEQISTMLSFLQHSRSSCSDENPCNGSIHKALMAFVESLKTPHNQSAVIYHNFLFLPYGAVLVIVTSK